MISTNSLWRIYNISPSFRVNHTSIEGFRPQVYSCSCASRTTIGSLIYEEGLWIMLVGSESSSCWSCRIMRTHSFGLGFIYCRRLRIFKRCSIYQFIVLLIAQSLSLKVFLLWIESWKQVAVIRGRTFSTFSHSPFFSLLCSGCIRSDARELILSLILVCPSRLYLLLYHWVFSLYVGYWWLIVMQHVMICDENWRSLIVNLIVFLSILLCLH